MLQVEARQRFSKAVTLGTGDASKEIMPAVTGVTYHVMNVVLTCLVSAAQAIYVGDSSGTVKALSLAANFPLHSQAAIMLLEGLGITIGESLVVKPASPGPSFHAVVEGYLVKQVTI